MKIKFIINMVLVAFLLVTLVQALETFDDGVVIVQRATSGVNIVAANIVSYNPDASAVWVTGRESKYGTVKIGHIKPDGIDDANAAALSLYNSGSGTKAQGIFLDSDASSGKLLNLRKSKVEQFVVTSDGVATANQLVAKNGASGTYTSREGKKVTVKNGIIVSIQ